MNRVRVLVVAGVVATVGGLWIAATVPDPVGAGEEPGGLVRVLALGGLAGAAYLLYDVTRSGSSEDPVPWSDAGPIVDARPEAHPDSPPLAGRQFSETLLEATETARRHRRLESGIVAVRKPLQQAYLEAMEAGGADRAAAERALAEGTWTDDALATAVLSPEVPLPPRSLRRRILDWLYPGRAVRRLTRRAVDAVATAGADRIPPVVGQDAPRNVPVYRPSLAAFQRGPGGEVRGPGGSWRPTRTDEPADSPPEANPREQAPPDHRGGEASVGDGHPNDDAGADDGRPNGEGAGDGHPGTEVATGDAHPGNEEVRST